jgi:hypothetical protein
MAKVSIGLQGWRFEESEVFTEEGAYRPFDAMDEDVRNRLIRLDALVGAPCDACWLETRDRGECNTARYVYGEPLAEVVVCEAHEPDFVYWFQEADGRAVAGESDFDDHFHRWFADGNRAPEGFEGMEYVATHPDELPDPPSVDPEDVDLEVGEVEERIDVRSVVDDGGEDGDDEAGPPVDDDLDLSTDYPKR